MLFRSSPKKALDELVMFNQHTRLKQHLVSRIFLPAECLFQGNKLAFQEMVVCLLNNAYESYLAAKNRLVFLSATVENDLLKLVVTDGGRGMSWLAKTLSVSPLYTSKNNHAGLGLYFVKKTIEAEFSGKLLLRSRLHKGTSATLLFPLKSNQAITEPSSSFYY